MNDDLELVLDACILRVEDDELVVVLDTLAEELYVGLELDVFVDETEPVAVFVIGPLRLIPGLELDVLVISGVNEYLDEDVLDLEGTVVLLEVFVLVAVFVVTDDSVEMTEFLEVYV
jgi:hypothetical protein